MWTNEFTNCRLFQLMAELGCSRRPCPPDEITNCNNWMHLSSIKLLSWTLQRSELEIPGRPSKWSGDRRAGGPPGLSFKRLYSQQDGEHAQYATLPLAAIFRSLAKASSFSKSSQEWMRISNWITSPFNAWIAEDNGAQCPQQTSKKNLRLVDACIAGEVGDTAEMFSRDETGGTASEAHAMEWSDDSTASEWSWSGDTGAIKGASCNCWVSIGAPDSNCQWGVPECCKAPWFSYRKLDHRQLDTHRHEQICTHHPVNIC